MNGSSTKRSLVVGFMNGRLPKTYLQKDYEQLQLAINQANNESKRSEKKINVLEQNNKAAIELQLDAIHQRIWLKEWERLTSFRARFQRDLDEVLQLISLSRDDRSLIEIVEQQESLDEDLLHFQQSTLAPVGEFCSDIEYWVKNRKRDVTLGQDPNLIKETINSIKSQQCELLEMMEDEQKQLERMLNIRNFTTELDDSYNFPASELGDMECASVRSGATECCMIPSRLPLPADILESDCDSELKEELLREFATIDASFQEQLLTLQERILEIRSKIKDALGNGGPSSLLQAVVDESRVGDLDPWKMHVFEAVYRRAPQDIPKSWYFLYVHFLHLMYPRHKRWQLTQCASIVHQYVALKSRFRIITNDWRRAHGELVDQVRDTLAEFAEKQKEAEQRNLDLAEQRKLCSKLAHQVNQWRRLKMEEAQLQNEIDMAKMQSEAEHLAALAEKEKEETRLKKEKIAKFKDDKEKKRADAVRKAEERLAEVRRQLAEQAELDWERINFRKTLFEDKCKAAEEKAREAEEEEIKKEERLEALRRLVRVEAPSNLARTMGDTENWKNHDERYLKAIRADMNLVDTYEWYSESKPMFNNPSYTAKQILSDKRVQLEQRLRETGLIASEYGRQLVAQMKAPTVTRRDQLGTLGVSDLAPPPNAFRPQLRVFQPYR